MSKRSECAFFKKRHTDGPQAHEDGQLITEKCKWKPQWDITSHLSEWPSSQSPQIKNVAEDVEKKGWW